MAEPRIYGQSPCKHRWSLDREANEPHTVHVQREVGFHYSPTVLGNQPEIHHVLMINESGAGSAAPSRAPSQGPSAISWQ
eukprot:7688213-Pyramimonas_sp.AAC.1